MARGKKLGTEILSIRDFAEGVEGMVGEIKPLLKKDGSQVVGSFGQSLMTLDLSNPSTGEIKTVWCDGGLRGELSRVGVKPGQCIAIVHTGEGTFENEQGQTCKIQKYDIFEASM